MSTIRIEDCPRDREGRPQIPVGCTLEPMDNGKPKSATKTPSKIGNRSAATSDRFQVLNAFTDFSIGELTRSEIVTWLILYRDVKDGLARTSQTDIARRGGLTARSVATAVSGLLRRRLVKLVRRGGLRQGPSVYRVRSLMK